MSPHRIANAKPALLQTCRGGLRGAALSAAALCGLAVLSPAGANVINGASSSYGESVAIGATTPVGITLTTTSGPLPAVSGTAPAPYGATQTAVSASAAGVLSTGVLVSNAASNVDGLAGLRSATASATVNSLVIGILSVLGLTADTVASTAGVSGAAGALVASGTTTITNLRLNNVLVTTASLLPNTVVLDAAGVKVTLNEQTSTGDGTTGSAFSVNAIDVSFTNAARPIIGDLLGRSDLLNGNIVIGHSDAALAAVADLAVPEPASMLLLGCGLLGLAAVRSRRGSAASAG